MSGKWGVYPGEVSSQQISDPLAPVKAVMISPCNFYSFLSFELKWLQYIFPEMNIYSALEIEF